MPSADAVVETLAQIPTTSDHLSLSGDVQFSTQQNTTGEESVIASYQFDLPSKFSVREPVGIALTAYETFAQDGNSDQDTFNLSHDIVDSPATPEALVAYENGNRVTMDSIDFANNTITYTDAGSGNDLHVFYTFADQAQMEVRKVSPGDSPDTLDTFPVGLANQRDQARDPFNLGATASPLHATVARDWTVEVAINTDVQVAFEAQSGGQTVTATNAILTFPVNQARAPLEGLSDVLQKEAATR